MFEHLTGELSPVADRDGDETGVDEIEGLLEEVRGTEGGGGELMGGVAFQSQGFSMSSVSKRTLG